MPEPPERTALYRLYDSSNVLLYVGISAKPEARWQQHSYSVLAPWWPQVARKELEWFPSRPEAYEAETRAIKEEGPLHNRAMRADHRSFIKWRNSSPEIQWIDRHLNPWSDQMANILRNEIKAGVIAPGTVMPTTRELHYRFGISQQTCGRVLRRLAAEGAIYQRRKGGRYYALDLAAEPSDEPSSDRTVCIPVGRPEVAAAALLEAMTREEIAALAEALISAAAQ
jgi:DNA-binding transcriptional regulator YhcF (GntR family)/predicted GIY-YIG superfamily endonuclease